MHKSRKEVYAMLKKTLLLCAILLVSAFPAFARDFELTPAAAELLRERGSVGYLYWGYYREC